jgi:hypothetical protein
VLAVPDPDWTSDMPLWDSSNMPVITTTSNVTMINHQYTLFWMLWLKTTARLGGVVGDHSHLDWCVIENTVSNTAAVGVGGSGVSSQRNSVIRMSGTSYDSGLYLNSNQHASNCRVEGNASATTGSRYGINYSLAVGTSATARGCTSINNPGAGAVITAAQVNQLIGFNRGVLANNGTGFLGLNTAGQFRIMPVAGCMVTGNTTGVDAQQSNLQVTGSRLRNTTNFANTGNFPTDFGNDVSAGSDAAEYVNAAGGDYRIRSDSVLWGKGFGVSDQPASGGAAGPLVGPGRLVRV